MEVVGFKSSGFINSKKNRMLSHGRTAFGSREWCYPNFYGWTSMPQFHMNLNIQSNLTFRLRQQKMGDVNYELLAISHGPNKRLRTASACIANCVCYSTDLPPGD
jgi:hypothetical protein